MVKNWITLGDTALDLEVKVNVHVRSGTVVVS